MEAAVKRPVIAVPHCSKLIQPKDSLLKTFSRSVQSSFQQRFSGNFLDVCERITSKLAATGDSVYDENIFCNLFLWPQHANT